MYLSEEKNGNKLLFKLAGRLDTESSLDFEKRVKGSLGDAAELTIDLNEVEYVSSSGLRSLLAIQKAIEKKDGKMLITNVGEVVSEVFSITGFDEFLNIV